MENEFLTTNDFEIMCSILDTFFDKFPDPSPDYRQSDFSKLDMVINAPKQTFGGIDLYPTLFDKAGCYFYFINKFHPFNNGNKRVSIVSTYVYLRYNGYILFVDNETLYRFAKDIAESQAAQEQDFKKVVEFLKKFSEVSKKK